MQSSPERPGTTELTSPTPLTITSVLGQGVGTGNAQTPPDDIDFTALTNTWIYHSTFAWSENAAISQNLLTLNTKNMWKGSSPIPWQIYTHGITQYISYGYEVCLLFVKLPDVRVSLEIEHHYSHPQFVQTGLGVENSAEQSIIEINNEETITFKMIPYWNGVTALNMKSAGSSVDDYWPKVVTDVKVRLPYVPNNLQPKTFNVLVFVRPCDEFPQGTIVDPTMQPLAL